MYIQGVNDKLGLKRLEKKLNANLMIQEVTLNANLMIQQVTLNALLAFLQD